MSIYHLAFCSIFVNFITINAQIKINENGLSNTGIICDGKTVKSAELLSKYLTQTTSNYYPILKNQDSKHEIFIYLRCDSLQRGSNVDNKKALFLNKFTIDFPKKNRIVITGDNETAVEFGVYEFLERFVGIRWLFPGEEGEYIPKNKVINVEVKKITGNPLFMMRVLSGLHSDEENWARKNRMYNPGIKFHHNMGNIFPSKKYRVTHPEFYPLLKGERYNPLPGVKVGWQPCFSAPTLIDEAVKNICEYFAANPNEISFSLGVNDGGGYCQCVNCLEKVKGNMKNDYSNLYYSWANSVVSRVLEKYPDKWFGCLAYSYVTKPPSDIKLHPRIIPFITFDRMKWIDPIIQSEAEYQDEQWKQKATNIGWYDYIYGKQYIVPRIYFHHMASYLQYAAENGINFLYSEAYPHWREGPKLYLALRLQWNPYINVDSTLNDWYQCAVGADAAPYLSLYFSFWEEFWTIRIPQSEWFTSKNKYHRPYSSFKDSRYLKILNKKDIDYCKGLLDTVSVKAITQEQKNRAQYFIETFIEYKKEAINARGKIDFRGILDHFDFR